MCFQMEKLVKENDDKLSDADKTAVSGAIEKVREAAKTDDVDKIKSAMSELEQASHALSKAMYEAAGAAGAAGAAPGATPPPTGAPAASEDDDTIDADFEVKNE